MKTRARNELPTVWEVPDALWETIIAPILTEFDPPSKRGRGYPREAWVVPTRDDASMALSIEHEPVANGIICPKSLAMMQPSIEL